MLTLFAAFATLAIPLPGPVAPQRQAQATVRIVPFAAVRFGDIERRRPLALRSTMIRSTDGTAQAARLLEFE